MAKNLLKAANNKLDAKKELVTVSSLLTHSLIEFNKDEKYILCVASLYQKLGDLIQNVIKKEK